MACPFCAFYVGACPMCVSGPQSQPPLDAVPSGRACETFGTAMYPLRCSNLNNLATCPWSVLMTHLFDYTDESGPAADTGSATHAAVEHWHRYGQDAAASVEAMVARNGEFPAASLEEAAGLFLLYTRDPRNRDAVFATEDIGRSTEVKVGFSLPPAEGDTTGQPVVFQGKIDQVRRDPVSGRLKVFDLKTSKLPGRTLLDDHLYQMAGYVVGATLLYGEPVWPGSLICVRHYGTRQPETSPDGVFFPFSWGHNDARFVLWGIRRIVAALRSGEIWHHGGMHCRWCQARSTDVCVPRLRASTNPQTMRISLPLSLPYVGTGPTGTTDDEPQFPTQELPQFGEGW